MTTITSTGSKPYSSVSAGQLTELSDGTVLKDKPVSTALTSEDVSQFLNDYPEVNRLIDGKEFTSDRIQTAIKFVLSEWNETPPVINVFTESNFPYKTTLLYGVVGFLFRGEAAFQERNHLPYQSGGLSVDDSNKSNAYIQFANMFDNKFQNLMQRQKVQENLNRGWRTVSSDYSTLGYRG